MWGEKIKRIPREKISIIKATILLDEANILDLRNEEFQQLFHEYRDKTYKKLVEGAKENNKKLKDSEKNGRIIDCTTINMLCKKMNFYAVIVRRYINFKKGEDKEFYSNYTSQSPNCSILSLRNQTYITNKEDVTHDK